MTNLTSAQPLSLELQDELEKLRDISIYDLAELVHNERTAAPSGASKSPLVRLYEQYIHAVASHVADDQRRRKH
jgi:hypothetical protein